GVIQPGGFGDTLIELSGLSHAPQIPLLADHDANLDGIVGQGSPVIHAGSLTINGTLTTATEAARQIVQLSREGFKFQASVGVTVGERQHVKAGDTITANGRSVTAGSRGLLHVTKGTLKEVSILALGADGTTTVNIAAAFKGSH